MGATTTARQPMGVLESAATAAVTLPAAAEGAAEEARVGDDVLGGLAAAVLEVP